MSFRQELNIRLLFARRFFELAFVSIRHVIGSADRICSKSLVVGFIGANGFAGTMGVTVDLNDADRPEQARLLGTQFTCKEKLFYGLE